MTKRRLARRVGLCCGVASALLVCALAGGSLAFGAELLDGRQWERVSPEQKHGAVIEQVSYEGGGMIAAEANGNALTYLANNPIEASPPGNRGPEQVQILATRTGGSWQNRTIATPHGEIKGGLVTAQGSEYLLFSPDLSRALVEPREATPLAAGATQQTEYVRDNAACEVEEATCYTPLLTPADTVAGAEWGRMAPEQLSRVRVAGATSDLAHVVIHSKAQLTANAATAGLYEWTGGQLQLVSVLPAGEGETAVNGWLGAQEDAEGQSDARNAISSDGSRIVWSSGRGTTGHLYLRDTSSERTTRLDEPEPGAAGGTAAPVFDIATADISRIFFTDRAALTVGATAVTSSREEGDLYECEVVESAGGLSCDLTDITGAGIDGQVLGMSADGAYLYFVSNAVLAAGAPQPSGCNGFAGGTCNLYLAHRSEGVWSIDFIATLSEDDAKDWGSSAISAAPDFGRVTAKASSSGRYLTFMSDRELTGYDNDDAGSGVPDEEVFFYDADAPEAQRLHCISCDPAGAPPTGIDVPPTLAFDAPLVDTQRAWVGHWLAGNLPPWISHDEGGASFYQPRYLADSGRVFFDSSDALVPHDTNGLEDVYEYEPAGVDSCTSAAARFSTAAGGCVALISSGTSNQESAFLDASANGDDAFFLTNTKLVPEDEDAAYDVYDAHVCTASVPCREVTVPPPPCESNDACKPAQSAQPAIYGAPASETFSGAGNAASTKSTHRVRKSGSGSKQARARRRARALKRCAKRSSARARAACRRRVRMRRAHARSACAGRRSARPRAKCRACHRRETVASRASQRRGRRGNSETKHGARAAARDGRGR